MSSNFEMFGAEEGWEQPFVGDLVEVVLGTFKKEMGVVVEPCDAIKRDDLWCQVLLNSGKTKILPKRDVTVIQRVGTATQDVIDGFNATREEVAVNSGNILKDSPVDRNFSITNFNSFLAKPFFLKIGFTKIYSISPFLLNLTKPTVVFKFLNDKTPSASSLRTRSLNSSIIIY